MKGTGLDLFLKVLSESLLTIIPKVVLGSQEASGKEPRGAHQEVPREASNFFSRVIEKAKLKLIPFDQLRLRREIKETPDRC